MEKCSYNTDQYHFADIVSNIFGIHDLSQIHSSVNSSNEINIFLPLTNAFDTNTIWAESEEDKGNYAPMNANYGEYYIWNGANLLHGNKKNETGASRVSLDFRFIFPENFNYSGSSVTHNLEMSLGKYWSKLD